MGAHGRREPFPARRRAAIVAAVNRYLPSFPELSRSVVIGLAVALATAWAGRRFASLNNS
jgi:hypothetical protein